MSPTKYVHFLINCLTEITNWIANNHLIINLTVNNYLLTSKQSARY